MLFKFLKLFGLDVPAQMVAAKASLDLRLEDAKDDFTRMAVQAAVIAALFAFAAIAGAMALGVALFALYEWTAEKAGIYAGLGAVGAALIVVATILAIVAAIRSRSFRRIEKRPYATFPAGATFDTRSVSAAADGGAKESGSVLDSSDSATPAPAKASASDLVEPMAFFLSKVVKYPRAGNPIVDELIENLRDSAGRRCDPQRGPHSPCYCAKRRRVHRLAFGASVPALI